MQDSRQSPMKSSFDRTNDQAVRNNYLQQRSPTVNEIPRDNGMPDLNSSVSSIQDRAQELIEKYSKGSFNNNNRAQGSSQSAGASGLASRINKAIIKTKSS